MVCVRASASHYLLAAESFYVKRSPQPRKKRRTTEAIRKLKCGERAAAEMSFVFVHGCAGGRACVRGELVCGWLWCVCVCRSRASHLPHSCLSTYSLGLKPQKPWSPKTPKPSNPRARSQNPQTIIIPKNRHTATPREQGRKVPRP